MNHALTTSSVLQSFRVLWQWLMAKPGQPWQAVPRPVAAPQRVGAADPAETVTQSRHADQLQSGSSVVRPVRPVRVLQVLESGQSPSQSGRLRISGRMADVCAELDRLAAREALQH